jgi:hypothetical protein
VTAYEETIESVESCADICIFVDADNFYISLSCSLVEWGEVTTHFLRRNCVFVFLSGHMKGSIYVLDDNKVYYNSRFWNVESFQQLDTIISRRNDVIDIECIRCARVLLHTLVYLPRSYLKALNYRVSIYNLLRRFWMSVMSRENFRGSARGLFVLSRHFLGWTEKNH